MDGKTDTTRPGPTGRNPPAVAQRKRAGGRIVAVPQSRPHRHPTPLTTPLSRRPLPTNNTKSKSGGGPKFGAKPPSNDETTRASAGDAVVNADAEVEGTEDLITLHPLTELAVVSALRTQFKLHRPYAYAGPTLVAVNPFEPRAEQYTPAVMCRYLDRTLQSPHLFMVALRAIDRVTESPQLLLVTGESGAGKSFSAKTMLRFLTCRDLAADTGETAAENGHSGRDADDAGGAADRPRPRQPVSTKAGGLPPSSTGAVLTRLINGGSEILEAFGNARTRMNANSSRFGKFVQIEYDDQKRISGSRVRTFLLERTRLTSKAPSEGNFHIFYQILGGLPASKLADLRLTRDPNTYRLLGVDSSVPTHSGREDYGTALAWTERTMDALTCIGVTAANRADLVAVLAGILHLGNVTTPTDHPDTIKDAASALGVDATALHRRLSHRVIRIRDDEMVRPTSTTEFETSRDSLIKLLYVAVFEWLVSQMSYVANPGVATTPRRKSVAQHRASSPTTPAASRYIGLIDIFGFETCDTNSLEQFCINYANEKVQQHFVRQVLSHHRDEFIREGISLDHIDVPDNRDCLALFEGSCQLFRLLDEECVLSRSHGPTPGRLAAAYEARLGEHRHFFMPRASPGCFGVRHYCGDTVYDAKLFVMKNQERIDAEHVEVLHASSLPTLPAMLVAAAEETIHPPCTSTAASAAKKDTSGPGKRQRQRSVVSQFQSSLDTLLGHFAEAQACYIRCIKPNAAGIPKQFDDDKVLEQLRNNGVVETIKISTQSFPRSILFDSFLDLFSTLATSESAAPAALGASSGTAGTSTIDRVRTVCTSVLPHSQVETVLIGKTKVFIPQATLDVLERAVMRHRLRGVLCLQRVWRRLRAAKSARRAAEAEASQAEVAKAYAAKKARRRNRRDAARASFATLMSEPAEQIQTAAAATKISSASGHPRFNNDLSSPVTNVVVAPQRRPTREVAPLTETTDSPHDTVWFGVSVVPYMLLPMLKAAVAYEKRGGTAMFKSKSTLSRYPLPSVTTFCAQRTPVPNAHRLPAICASEAALGLRWLIE